MTKHPALTGVLLSLAVFLVSSPSGAIVTLQSGLHGAEKQTMSGDFAQGGGTFPFSLSRTGDATPATMQSTDLTAFAWLEGEWQRATRSGVSIERWRRVPGVGLVGEGARLPDGADTEIHSEALLLVTMGADTFYIARPAENPYPTAFRLISLTDDTAVFENPTHDFPQRITYQRVSEEAMTASIEGPGDGAQVRRIDFEFVRR